MCEFASLRHRLLWYRVHWCDGSRRVELLRLLLLHVIETLHGRTDCALQRYLFSLATWLQCRSMRFLERHCSPQDQKAAAAGKTELAW